MVEIGYCDRESWGYRRNILFVGWVSRSYMDGRRE